jgi:hypothetical protein
MSMVVSEPRGVHLSLFVERDLRVALQEKARANERSLSGEARLALRRHLEGAKSEEEKG